MSRVRRENSDFSAQRNINSADVVLQDLAGAPVGDAVGTTDEQTLTNKCFGDGICTTAIADAAFPVGTVLSASRTTDNRVAPCTVPDRSRMIGVSKTAATAAGDEVMLAIFGVVRVRVRDDEGLVVRGDFLRVENTTGVADATGFANGPFGIATEGAPGPGEQMVNMRFKKSEIY
jgi:hypothetical protein